jgi:DNA polymerase V
MLDDLLIPRPESTVIFPVRDWASQRFGLSPGDLLVVERGARPEEDQLIIILLNDQLLIKRFNQVGAGPVSVDSAITPAEQAGIIWGVVTYCIRKLR